MELNSAPLLPSSFTESVAWVGIIKGKVVSIDSDTGVWVGIINGIVVSVDSEVGEWEGNS